MATAQQSKTFPSVQGFTLNIGLSSSSDVGVVRIFDSHGWEFIGSGHNTGGRWRWEGNLGSWTYIVLDDRKQYGQGFPFGRIHSTQWQWKPLMVAFGLPKPWFNPPRAGLARIYAVDLDMFMSWALV
jgi:hypothetical protein